MHAHTSHTHKHPHAFMHVHTCMRAWPRTHNIYDMHGCMLHSHTHTHRCTQTAWYTQIHLTHTALTLHQGRRMHTHTHIRAHTCTHTYASTQPAHMHKRTSARMYAHIHRRKKHVIFISVIMRGLSPYCKKINKSTMIEIVILGNFFLLFVNTYIKHVQINQKYNDTRLM